MKLHDTYTSKVPRIEHLPSVFILDERVPERQANQDRASSAYRAFMSYLAQDEDASVPTADQSPSLEILLGNTHVGSKIFVPGYDFATVVDFVNTWEYKGMTKIMYDDIRTYHLPPNTKVLRADNRTEVRQYLAEQVRTELEEKKTMDKQAALAEEQRMMKWLTERTGMQVYEREAREKKRKLLVDMKKRADENLRKDEENKLQQQREILEGMKKKAEENLKRAEEEKRLERQRQLLEEMMKRAEENLKKAEELNRPNYLTTVSRKRKRQRYQGGRRAKKVRILLEIEIS